MRRLGWLVVLVVGAAVGGAPLAGCLGALTSERDRLKTAIEEYTEGLRWGKVDQCIGRLPFDKRAAFAERFALVEDLEVVEYDVQRINWDRQRSTADVRVMVSWSIKRRGLVERTVVDQLWEDKHGWFMTRQKRLSGSQLPILDDLGP